MRFPRPESTRVEEWVETPVTLRFLQKNLWGKNMDGNVMNAVDIVVPVLGGKVRVRVKAKVKMKEIGKAKAWVWMKAAKAREMETQVETKAVVPLMRMKTMIPMSTVPEKKKTLKTGMPQNLNATLQPHG
jgi:hypothetical protein